jgi:hypothetical protein
MDITKPFFAFVLVGISGLLLILYNRLAPESNEGYGMMVSNHQINTYAREACLKALRGKLDESLHMPSEIQYETQGSVSLSWKPGKDTAHAVSCRYEISRGVTDVSIDGVSLGAVSVDISDDPAARAPGALMEKHWGHW